MRVEIMQASGINIKCSFGRPVAAKQETINGIDSFGFFLALVIRASTACLTSLKTSPAYPGKTQMKIMSHSLIMRSLLNSAMIPNSCVKGLSKCGCLVLTSILNWWKLGAASKNLVKIIVPTWPQPMMPTVKGAISTWESLRCWFMNVCLYCSRSLWTEAKKMH